MTFLPNKSSLVEEPRELERKVVVLDADYGIREDGSGREACRIKEAVRRGMSTQGELNYCTALRGGYWDGKGRYEVRRRFVVPSHCFPHSHRKATSTSRRSQGSEAI